LAPADRRDAILSPGGWSVQARLDRQIWLVEAFFLISLPHDLLILGASARAAAMSALRCGLRPRCADYFGDRDVAALCHVDRVDPRRAARQFLELSDALDPTPWFYTGGFENHPDWVDQISRRHSLWGVDGQSVRAIRDPTRMAAVLSQRGIPCPAARLDLTGSQPGAKWLKKLLVSGGGRGIERVTHRNDPGSPSHYFQELIEGPSYSALYIGDRSKARLIGTTRQLIGINDFPFAYVGSVGPIPVPTPLAARLVDLGDALAGEFGLAGWFGVDYIVRDGIPWPVEINPRYTASLEIHELALGRSLVPEHRAACEPNPTASQKPPQLDLAPRRVIAKWVLYAPRQLVAPDIDPDENESNDLFDVPSIADIPWPGTRFGAGEPVLTLFSQGADRAECRSGMIRLVQKWMTRLGIAGDEWTTSALSEHSWRSGEDDVHDV
jgi:predicted ATP-grasp superfamily ATP-dependent carboligase